MKHIAVALIVLALIAADFGSHLWLSKSEAHGWALTDTFGLIAAVLWFWHHREVIPRPSWHVELEAQDRVSGGPT